MSKYQYILLDWDGNLAQTLHIWLKACKRAASEQGIDKSDQEIASSFGQFTYHLQQWGVPDIAAAVEMADKLAKAELPEVDLYPDALEVLEGLRELGKKLALITTSPHANIEHLLRKHSLMQTFDTIIAADDTTKHKPDPEPLELGLERLGGNKAEAVMIGDSDKDLGAAKNAGIDSILFYPKEHEVFYKLEDLKQFNPTYIVEDFRDILSIV